MSRRRDDDELTRRRSAIRLAAVIVASLAIGALTRIGEVVLPDEIQSAANSTAPWVLAAFAMVALSGLRRWSALIAGAGSFIAMDLSFYAAFSFTGGYYPRHYLLFWMIIAVIAGPLVGLAATWLRRDGIRRAVATAAVPAVCLGEGAFILIRLPIVGHVYPVILMGGGVLLLVGMLLWSRRAPRDAVNAIASTAAGAALFALAYNLVPLIIGKVVP